MGDLPHYVVSYYDRKRRVTRWLSGFTRSGIPAFCKSRHGPDVLRFHDLQFYLAAAAKRMASVYMSDGVLGEGDLEWVILEVFPDGRTEPVR